MQVDNLFMTKGYNGPNTVSLPDDLYEDPIIKRMQSRDSTPSMDPNLEISEEHLKMWKKRRAFFLKNSAHYRKEKVKDANVNFDLAFGEMKLDPLSSTTVTPSVAFVALGDSMYFHSNALDTINSDSLYGSFSDRIGKTQKNDVMLDATENRHENASLRKVSFQTGIDSLNSSNLLENSLTEIDNKLNAAKRTRK
ncbi:hypothetical protein HK099_007550, partial [Clydaea vesicula]